MTIASSSDEDSSLSAGGVSVTGIAGCGDGLGAVEAVGCGDATTGAAVELELAPALEA